MRTLDLLTTLFTLGVITPTKSRKTIPVNAMPLDKEEKKTLASLRGRAKKKYIKSLKNKYYKQVY